jgi:hypothetical protein
MFEALHPNLRNGQFYDALFKFDRYPNSNTPSNTQNEKKSLVGSQRNRHMDGHFNDVYYKNLKSNQKQKADDFYFYKSI